MLKWKVGSVVHEKDSDSYFVNVYYENLQKYIFNYYMYILVTCNDDIDKLKKN